MSDVLGNFLYHSYLLTDVDMTMEIANHDPKVKQVEKVIELLKGIGVRPVDKRLKLQAVEFGFGQVLGLLTSRGPSVKSEERTAEIGGRRE